MLMFNGICHFFEQISHPVKHIFIGVNPPCRTNRNGLARDISNTLSGYIVFGVYIGCAARFTIFVWLTLEYD
jgi:hypothetical protein